MAVAYGWVARMTTVVLEMVLPGLGGQWLDSKLGTNYLVMVGFGLGFLVGVFHLLHMVKPPDPKITDDNKSQDSVENP
jgi:hypothetical protein